ncbi:MAG: flagellum-specific ATP synthase FliI, partial [Pararhodobacter sp.]|nr:flagellum-specific ATP synthase FliI [Pararhodobacter sp.]
MTVFEALLADLAEVRTVRHFGRIAELHAATVLAQGLSLRARLGDRVQIATGVGGEILSMTRDGAEILPDAPLDGLAIGHPVEHHGANTIAPDNSWIGRVIDPYGAPLDGRA